MLHGINSRAREIEPMDPTPVKRARLTGVGTIQSGKSHVKTPPIEIITTPETPQITPAPTKEKVEKMQIIVQKRFRRALRSNDGTMLTRCIESGYVPSIQEWQHIIVKLHVSTSLRCVKLVRSLENICLNMAIKRQHKMLFQSVIQRVDSATSVRMEDLLIVPAMYLDGCLWDLWLPSACGRVSRHRNKLHKWSYCSSVCSSNPLLSSSAVMATTRSSKWKNPRPNPTWRDQPVAVHALQEP